MSDIRLIATDIDGTLLPSGWKTIPERVIRAFTQVSATGISIVPASGRLISAIPKELMDIPGIEYAITCNGASITDVRNRETLYQKRIPKSLAAELLTELKHYDVYSCVYLPSGAYNWSRLHPGLWKTYANRLPFFSQNPQEDLAAFMESQNEWAEKIFVAVFDVAERDRLRRELSRRQDIHITSSSAWNLEINHVEADKGQALAWLARHLELTPDQVAAMGDNENDYSMLTYAGTVIVPENGTPTIRQLASRVVPPCTECGTAVFLEELAEKNSDKIR